MKAQITVGISASGKSTHAAEQLEKNPNCVEINRDNVRRSIFEKNNPTQKFLWSKWNWKNEKNVTDICIDQISAAYEAKKDIIVSDTNLHPGRRQDLISRLKAHGYSVEIIDFPVTLEEAWKRDAARENGVGHSVIARQYQDWLTYIGRKDQYLEHMSVFIANPGDQPRCILVDIDGTLAHMNGKRGAFDWDKVYEDDLDEVVKFIIHSANISGIRVIILSGRDGCCEVATREWLIKHRIVFDHLIMRAPGDMRKDTIVKEEIFWRDIADNYNVQFVIDDRPSVCRMWRELGLKVLQVGDPHIEF